MRKAYLVSLAVGLIVVKFLLLIAWAEFRPFPFPTLYAERYVSVYTNRFRELEGETYVVRFVDLINSAEIRRQTLIESERMPTPGQSPDEMIIFIREDGHRTMLLLRGDVIDYRTRYLIVDPDAFYAELERLFQEIRDERRD